MKRTKFLEEIKKFDSKQLKEKLDQLRRELFSLRLHAQTSHVKDYALFQKLKKDIARVQTTIHAQEAQR